MFKFPDEPQRFVGRLLPMLRATQAFAPGSARRGVLFHGMAGGGKTACALELAYSYQPQRGQRPRFQGYVFQNSPDQDTDIATALVDCLTAIETQLDMPPAEGIMSSRRQQPMKLESLSKVLNGKPHAMSVTYFRTRRAGPETAIEDAVAAKVPELFDTIKGRCWTAGSLPIGAGMPDLAIVTFEPYVVAASKLNVPDGELLAYLRVVRRARPDTIAKRTGRPMKAVIRILHDMREAQIVCVSGEAFALHKSWRNVLPEIVTVEAKVGNWQVALAQAIRNGIFAHRSYIAMPSRVARRIRSEIALRHYGVGVLAVNDDDVVEIKKPRRRVPRVWSYYYRIAVEVAQHFLGD